VKGDPKKALLKSGLSGKQLGVGEAVFARQSCDSNLLALGERGGGEGVSKGVLERAVFIKGSGKDPCP